MQRITQLLFKWNHEMASVKYDLKSLAGLHECQRGCMAEKQEPSTKNCSNGNEGHPQVHGSSQVQGKENKTCVQQSIRVVCWL
jgi:hypothetical protein